MTGLRERKKARTRATIQQHALRLFREHGYAATTVEQIAEAAEVSPSTFFRYFPTKEDVALYDALDPILFEAFRNQPPELSPVAAIRAAMRSVFGAAPADEVADQEARTNLIMAVPELRMRMLDESAGSLAGFAVVVGERMQLPANDIAVRTLVSVIFGVAMVAWFDQGSLVSGSYFEAIDEILERIENGLLT